MTTLKRSHWTTLLHFCNVYGALLLCQICKVQSQCIDGYELGCIWTHDEKAPLRWVTETGRFIHFITEAI
ncbi:hypothetical protein CEXT_682191 [Caerostris extrusa]|uniref:Secreted protein n=1 Tax=Caerostris extrusa TaxID=172846 RepID=A0AAV4PEQ5_CAEEX|nr:hypothetical protein CEXT_682191 [Caerostris extrusa]